MRKAGPQAGFSFGRALLLGKIAPVDLWGLVALGSDFQVEFHFLVLLQSPVLGADYRRVVNEHAFGHVAFAIEPAPAEV